MDRNTIIGIALIAVIIIGYSIFSMPSAEELEAKRQVVQNRRDSLQLVEYQKLEKLKNNVNDSSNILKSDTLAIDSVSIANSDSLMDVQLTSLYGPFAKVATGEQKFITLENDRIKLMISTKGARPYSVQLKEYKRFDSTDVVLFEGDKSTFRLNFFAHNRNIATDSLYFETTAEETNIVSNGTKQISFKAKLANGKYIEHLYSLDPESYLVNFNVNFVGLNENIAANQTQIELEWKAKIPGQEKGADWEDQNTTIYYKHLKDEVNYLSERSDEELEDISTNVKWIAFKQQFFSSVLIADEHFSAAKLEYKKSENFGKDKYLKDFEANIKLPYRSSDSVSIPLSFYFGPNKYSDLKETYEEQNLELEELVPLGWFVFRIVNKYAIIPLFNLLGSWITNYGLIILLMTIIIKLGLFPLTFKSYLSTARMRVLKPQIDVINEKYGKDKAMEKQKATMELYKKAGVSPLGGCLPMILQMPILIAMYRFFPASIELRQQSFLWATDLSTYDAIFSWTTQIPLISEYYGNHVSLFTLLMAASMVITTKMNSGQMQMGGANSQMPSMKLMMYLMPVMMLFWFNKYSSGLSYYYFLANIITFLQTIVIRRFVDDKAILEKLNAKKAKPSKKSNFQKRLEDMAKQKGYKK